MNDGYEYEDIANKIRITLMLIGIFILNIIKYSLLFIIISIVLIILNPLIILLKIIITPWAIKKILHSYHQWETENTSDKLKKQKMR